MRGLHLFSNYAPDGPSRTDDARNRYRGHHRFLTDTGIDILIAGTNSLGDRAPRRGSPGFANCEIRGADYFGIKLRIGILCDYLIAKRSRKLFFIVDYLMNNGDSCDFCRATLILKVYQCDGFSLNGVPFFGSSSSAWTACSECSDLVDAEKWPELADRAYRFFLRSHGGVGYEESSIRADLSQVVMQFAVHRKR